MKNLVLFLVLMIYPMEISAKIVQHTNPDGSITYTNIHEVIPEKIEKDVPNVGDIIEEIKIYSISTKPIRRSSNYVYVGIKIKVKNLSADQEVRVKVECLDRNGFQLDYTYVDGIIVPGKTGYITDQIMLEKAIYSKVAEWKAK